MKAPLQLLIVEDSAADAELIVRYLRKTGLDVVARRVETEADLLSALEEQHPDVILSDFSLPQFSGLRALETSLAHAPDTPFIYVSGTIGEERAIDALRRGATDYVLKTNLTRLSSTLERALREAALKVEQRKSEVQKREQEHRLQRLTRSYRMLSSTSSAILRLRDRSELLDEVCRIAVQQAGYDRVSICLLDTDIETPRLRSQAGADSDILIAAELAIAEETVRSKVPTVSNDLPGKPLCREENAELVAQGYRAVAALPLLIDGTAVGVITLFSRQYRIFDDAELTVLSELTANLSFALQYLQKDEALHFLSYFDSLTGLAKRPLFCQRLSQQLLVSNWVPGDARTVVVFDIQKLGAINDSFGRYMGDLLIEQIAARLKQTLANPTVSPISVGEPLPSRSPPCPNPAMRRDWCRTPPRGYSPNRLNSRVRSCGRRSGPASPVIRMTERRRRHWCKTRKRPSRWHAKTTRSISSTVWSPGTPPRAVWHWKDAWPARSTAESFCSTISRKYALRTAASRVLRPCSAGRTLKTAWFPPSVFVPLLERSGAIVEVGEWILLQAVRDMRGWFASGLTPVRVAINVSPLQLRRRDFVNHVLANVEPARELGAGAIDIEITESMLLQDLELSIRKLAELREAGVGIAIDDFGTGYSSLSLLARLPVDTLKIDRSFVQSIADSPKGMTLVSTIVSLARSFDLRTVAEGVETAMQLQMLRLIKCDEAQGYLFQRPVAAADVPAVISRLPRDEGGRGYHAEPGPPMDCGLS